MAIVWKNNFWVSFVYKFLLVCEDHEIYQRYGHNKRTFIMYNKNYHLLRKEIIINFFIVFVNDGRAGYSFDGLHTDLMVFLIRIIGRLYHSVALKTVILGVCIILALLISIAYLTLAERKVIAAMQRRKGPNIVGFWGMLQPIADAVKLIVKETIIPSRANKWIFMVAPIITLTLSLAGWSVVPITEGMAIADVNLGFLTVFAVSSLGVYGIIIAGWSSNSRYAFLGGVRSAAQMISYEVSMGLLITNVLYCSKSVNLSEVVVSQQAIWFIVPLFYVGFIYFITILAETNRAPFDLPEAEAELVAGYFVEYSSISFALFFLGEYGSMILMCSLGVILFLGGWFGFVDNKVNFTIKVLIILILFIWVRAALPRYRYDQLMRLGWKVLLPLVLGWLIHSVGWCLMFLQLVLLGDDLLLNFDIYLKENAGVVQCFIGFLNRVG
jgi:NADH-quinone oxidoreductase subunit H